MAGVVDPSLAGKTQPGLLRLFRENIDTEERIATFRQATDVVAEQIHEKLEDGFLQKINERFGLKLVLNSHGDEVHAGQTLSHLSKPFITFVEGTNAWDMNEDPGFNLSVDNAFNIAFNAQPPLEQPPLTDPKLEWHYYRDRGLLNKGSIIAPIDVRSYAMRLFDALVGQDYSQDMLNQRMNVAYLEHTDSNQLVAGAVERGKIIMYSNGLREHISASQIVMALRNMLAVEGGEEVFGGIIDRRIKALLQDRPADEPLETGIIYGTAHHMFLHLLGSFGIQAERYFAGRDDEPEGFAFTGTNLDGFFGGYAQDFSEEQLARKGRALVLESLFGNVLTVGYEFQAVASTHRDGWQAWQKVPHLAWMLSSEENYEQIMADFKADKRSVVALLRDHGLKFRDI